MTWSSSSSSCVAVTLLLLLVVSHVVEGAFYVPGVAPESWAEGDPVRLNVNKISSVKTLLPYEYYDLPFCAPSSPSERSENIGEIMSGDAIMDSLYNIRMKKDVKCMVLCKPKSYSSQETQAFVEKIKNDYFVDWVVDNLPVLFRPISSSPSNENANNNAATPKRGYPLGDVDLNTGRYFLYNHVEIMLYITPEEGSAENSNKWRIVGFEVTPASIKHSYEEGGVSPGSELQSDTCNKFTNPLPTGEYQYLDGDSSSVLFTYDVQFIESDTVWEHRWDKIISSKTSNDQIHWFSIINSLMIVLFLSGMIAMILLRTLSRDINRYNSVPASEETASSISEESGWKLVHGDVFRPPSFSPMLFSVVVGTGVQVVCMSCATMVFALLGLLSPANRGSLLTTLLLLFVFMGSFAGYYSSRTFKMFNGKDWKANTVLVSFLYPGALFGIFFILNLFLWYEGSSQAVPFSTLFALLVLWFGISVPLVCVGSYIGFKADVVENPVRTNQIARQIPETMWYLSPSVSIMVGGILPFGAVFIELFFIMSALWLHQIYYVFGFLFIVLTILVITCAEMTIVMCYFQLCAEDYEWWWRSFLTSGSAAFYLFGYSILYFYTKLNITSFVSSMLYFGYMGMISVTFFFFTGTIGYFACLVFVRKIYGSIKID